MIRLILLCAWCYAEHARLEDCSSKGREARVRSCGSLFPPNLSYTILKTLVCAGLPCAAPASAPTVTRRHLHDPTVDCGSPNSSNRKSARRSLTKFGRQYHRLRHRQQPYPQLPLLQLERRRRRRISAISQQRKCHHLRTSTRPKRTAPSLALRARRAGRRSTKWAACSRSRTRSAAFGRFALIQTASRSKRRARSPRRRPGAHRNTCFTLTEASCHPLSLGP